MSCEKRGKNIIEQYWIWTSKLQTGDQKKNPSEKKQPLNFYQKGSPYTVQITSRKNNPKSNLRAKIHITSFTLFSTISLSQTWLILVQIILQWATLPNLKKDRDHQVCHNKPLSDKSNLLTCVQIWLWLYDNNGDAKNHYSKTNVHRGIPCSVKRTTYVHESTIHPCGKKMKSDLRIPMSDLSTI